MLTTCCFNHFRQDARHNPSLPILWLSNCISQLIHSWHISQVMSYRSLSGFPDSASLSWLSMFSILVKFHLHRCFFFVLQSAIVDGSPSLSTAIAHLFTSKPALPCLFCFTSRPVVHCCSNRFACLTPCPAKVVFV